MHRTRCLLVAALVLSAAPPLSADDKLVNLAASAKILANSEKTDQKLFVRGIADGRIARQGSNILEFHPESLGYARSWAVNGEEVKDRGELIFEWKEPVRISQIVYFGRTAWLVEECFKDYEILANDSDEPIAKGSFEKRYGAQSVTFDVVETTKLTLRFLNAHGGPNPGAAEILILEKRASDAALRNFAPDKPPTVVRPSPLALENIVWRTPSASEADSMPTGNGDLLANVWTDAHGDIHLSLAKLSASGGAAQRLADLRLRMDPPLTIGNEALRQSVAIERGAIQVASPKHGPEPTFSIAVDANHSLLHVQLRTEAPVELELEVKNVPGESAVGRLHWKKEKLACVAFCDGMSPKSPTVLHTGTPRKEFDLQIHVVPSDRPAKDVAKTDVNAAVRAHLAAWEQFWKRENVLIGSVGDDEALAAAQHSLTIRRYLCACSGRGPYSLKIDGNDNPKPDSSKPDPKSDRATSLLQAIEITSAWAKRESGTSRFPSFWGADFSRLPKDAEPIDDSFDAIASRLVEVDGDRTVLFPGWSRDLDVSFRVSAKNGVSVAGSYRDGAFEHIEVHPMRKTVAVVGAPPFEDAVRRGLAPRFQMPALVSYLSPSWVVGKAGRDALAVTMKEARFNGYEGNISDNAWCKKNGFYLMVHGASPWIAHELKDEPHVLSYFLSDRKKSGWFRVFAKQRAEYEAIAPHQATEFNTYAQWGSIEAFVDQVRPQLLEYYDYHWKRRADLHFHYLEYYRRMSLEAGGIPIFRYCHVHDDPPVKMRQTVSMSLVYGLKGFKWWVGWTMFDIHEVKENEPPPLSGIGRECKRINTTLAAFSPHVARARSVDVFHTKPLPVSTREAPADSWIRPSGEHIALGIFENEPDSGEIEHYVVVGNRDIGRKRTATLALAKNVTKAARKDKASGKWTELLLESREQIPHAVIELDAGDAELLRIWRQKR